MWNIEKFGAVGSRGPQGELCPSIFQNSEGPRGRSTSHLGLIAGLFFSGFYKEFRPFLTGSAPQTEINVTHSKQTTENFLTGSRTAIKRSSNWPTFCPEFFHGPRFVGCGSRLNVHGSRLLPVTS